MKSLLTIISMILLTYSIPAQPAGWQWGRKLAYTVPSLTGTDILGNIQGVIPYQRSITLEDTSFSHAYYEPPSNNCAMFDWDRNGKMIRLTDFHTVEKHGIYQFQTASDNRLNLYFTCQFIARIFTGDSVINHGPVPYIKEKEVCLARLNPGRQPDWIQTVSGFSHDICYGLGLGDSGLVLTTYHYGLLHPNRLLLMDSDTLTFDNPTMVISLTDTGGDLATFSTIRFLDNYINNVLFTKGGDGRFYLTGITPYGIIFQEDTIFNPLYPQANYLPFLITVTAGGSVQDIRFLPWQPELKKMATTKSGNHCFTSTVYGSFTIGCDTVSLTGDSVANLIFFTDSLDELKWYHLLKYKYSTKYPPELYISGFQDSIVFSTRCSGDFSFAGKTFHAGDSARLLTGLIGPNGIMNWHFLSEPVNDIRPTGILADRCGNLALTGVLSGTFIFGNDTLLNPTGKSTGFLARIERHQPESLNLGPDTASCVHHLLSGPPGFRNYCWNNGLSWEANLMVTRSGTYRLQVWNEELCYAEDSVHVKIWDIPVSGLSDTTLYYQDTLTLKIDSPYERIDWSTGDTGQQIIIPGSSLDHGLNKFFVEMKNGLCFATDTFYVLMQYHPGIVESHQKDIRLFPNPSHDKIFLVMEKIAKPALVTVTNVYGQPVYSNFQRASIEILNVSEWPAGIYIFSVLSDEKSTFIRFIRY